MNATARSVALARPGIPLLALGGGLKNTVCLVDGGQALISGVIGDLDTAAHRILLERTADRLCRARAVSPVLIVHDRHPEFFSTRLAQALAAQHGIPALAVQHHHAHIAAVCAEHSHTGPVLGLALDGFGLGEDDAAWGGELLAVEGSRCRRIGHLRPLAMPGGDRAALEPWRMAAAALHALDRNAEIAARWPQQAASATVQAMLVRGFNCPPTSSMGRLFDAAAGLLGVGPAQQSEGEAAMALQQRAEAHGPVEPMRGGYLLTDTLDFLPMLGALSAARDADYGAALFHATVAAGLAEWVLRAAEHTGIATLACGGGCFLNRHLLQSLQARLSARRLTVLTPIRLSPGDSALSLGQAWVGLDYQQGD